ncbi:unnamed protein product [[Actinomadura] parvosata subsp. kistnae]|nr:unnamed protein product [Actinomadura parvosata subsp. kistnae]
MGNIDVIASVCGRAAQEARDVHGGARLSGNFGGEWSCGELSDSG